MGNDTRSRCIHTWDMETYVDFSWWSSACIGYRFALIEYVPVLSFRRLYRADDILPFGPHLHRIKALFALIGHFEFELAVPFEDTGKKSTTVQRPLVCSDPAGGKQIPLLLKLVRKPCKYS